MITSLTEVLELSNFGHMAKFTRDEILCVTSWTEIMTSWPFFQKSFILRRSGVAIFANIIKILAAFIKTILEDSRKVRIIRGYVSEWNLYLIISESDIMIHIVFGSCLGKV